MAHFVRPSLRRPLISDKSEAAADSSGPAVVLEIFLQGWETPPGLPVSENKRTESNIA